MYHFLYKNTVNFLNYSQIHKNNKKDNEKKGYIMQDLKNIQKWALQQSKYLNKI